MMAMLDLCNKDKRKYYDVRNSGRITEGPGPLETPGLREYKGTSKRPP